MWCKSAAEDIEPLSEKLQSRSFVKRHAEQIGLVKDLSWVDLGALDGIEEEFASILRGTTSSSPASEIRNGILCEALAKRIGLLKRIADRRKCADV